MTSVYAANLSAFDSRKRRSAPWGAISKIVFSLKRGGRMAAISWENNNLLLFATSFYTLWECEVYVHVKKVLCPLSFRLYIFKMWSFSFLAFVIQTINKKKVWYCLIIDLNWVTLIPCSLTPLPYVNSVFPRYSIRTRFPWLSFLSLNKKRNKDKICHPRESGSEITVMTF